MNGTCYTRSRIASGDGASVRQRRPGSACSDLSLMSPLAQGVPLAACLSSASLLDPCLAWKSSTPRSKGKENGGQRRRVGMYTQHPERPPALLQFPEPHGRCPAQAPEDTPRAPTMGGSVAGELNACPLVCLYDYILGNCNNS